MKPYTPPALPPALDWSALVPAIGAARAALARYDGVLRGLVRPEILLSPLQSREAVLSSKIEGTQASLEEVLEFEADPGPKPEELPKADDIQEILNYRTALRGAVRELKTRPISLNMIRSIHRTLLDSVRGRDKARGEFRRTQNWIGRPGATIEEATYVPPPWQEIEPLLGGLEKYVHADEKDPLVQLALVHAQFELIHPFHDGNGRVGRLLIPLFLFEKEHIASPSFFMSAYLEANRDAYYDGLRGISGRSAWQAWVAFFLEAVAAQARADTEKASGIQTLYGRMKERVAELTRSQFVIRALDAFFSFPIFSAPDFARRSKIPNASANRILNVLVKGRVLRIVRPGKGRRPTVLSFPELLALVNA